MKIWDCHVHCYEGRETADEVLRGMDAAGITRLSLMGNHPGPLRELCPVPSAADCRVAIDHVAGLQAADSDRIFGLFWADPRTEGILDLLDYALVDKGLRGVKMIPNHWSACDEFMFPIYEKIRELDKILHFHAGILYAFGDSSRFCRPVLYEALINFPGLRFALAHIAWPWVDECLAVWGHFNSAAHFRQQPSQMWIDTCRGTPDAWRLEALQKAVPFCGTQRLMFGTDTYPGHLATAGPAMITKDRDLLRNVMGLSDAQLEEFFWGAAASFYGVE